MKKIYFKKYKLLYVGIVIIIIGYLGEINTKQANVNFSSNLETKKIQKEIYKKEKLAYQAVKEFSDIEIENIFNDFEKYIELSNEHHIFLYAYSKGNLLAWTSNKVLPVRKINENLKTRIQKLANGYYLQLNNSKESFTVIALIPIQSDYPLENNYLKNDFYFCNHSDQFELNFDNKVGTTPIYSNNGDELFKIASKESRHFKIFLYIFFLGLILIFLFIHTRISFLIKEGMIKSGFVFYLLSLVVVVIFWKIFDYPDFIFNLKLFSPEVYASSNLFSSLGGMFISVFFLNWLVFLFTQKRIFKIKNSPVFLIIYGIIIFSILILSAFSISIIIFSLVTDSNIVLDMNDFFSFNFYSLISFIIIFLLLSAYIKLALFLFDKINKTKLSIQYWLIIGIIPAVIFSFIFHNHYVFSYLHITFPLLVIIFCFFYKTKGKPNLSALIFFIMVASVFSAHQIINATKVKEHENRMLLANTLVTNRDISGELVLNKIIKKIKQDNFIKSYYLNPFISKKSLKQRLTKLYFTGYYSRYDVDIHTYSPIGNMLKAHKFSPLKKYAEVKKSAMLVDSVNRVFFINNYDAAPEYLVHLEIKKNQIILGQLLIELKQKPFLEESVYPELLIEKNIRRNDVLKEYSYAIYKNNNLVNQKGKYSYPLVLQNDEKSQYLFFNKNKYEHLKFKLSDEISIIMSKEANNIFSFLSLFSVLFIFSTIILSIGISLSKVDFFNKSNKYLTFVFWKDFFSFINLTFKSKIQLTILISLLIALGLTGFSIINYIKKNSKENAREKLLEEIKSITIDLDSYFKQNTYQINQLDREELYAKVKNLAHLFKSDINIFDTEGNLITSSQMPMYERKIISRKMDAEAFYTLRIKQFSQLIQDEKIGGKINYLSAYSMIRDNENQINYFVNLPYLAKERKLKQEISSLIVSAVNIYVFLFLLILLISFAIANTFTEPLEIIKTHLREIQFGKVNKKIKWNSNDEIGILINEYNQMITKVEESAKALARSERESAWREMARQVAHEIKNPLTPMKLNIQQLLKAWKENKPDIDERFDKTTKIIINRIDNLSQIATEFSQFARMPYSENKKMILEDTINDVSDLFIDDGNITFKTVLGTKNTAILADKDQLLRGLNNIIKNAIHAIPPEREGLIKIITHKENDNIIISITDNGSGIPDDIHNKIFIPNFSTKSSGMGLGLAIVSGIIKNAKGEIWFETKKDKGTTFFISFPICK
ncbi:MAG: ATP-binding protein [Bacteroidota bacterium]|nr:ATP-binding protein [Bacteroidota bacterium]